MRYLFVIILVLSCSTNKVEKKSFIENIDTTELKYFRSKDYNPVEIDNKKSMLYETINNSDTDFNEQLVDSDNPVAKLSGYCYQKNYTKAFDLANQNYNSHRNFPSYWNTIGNCYLLQKKYLHAQWFYSKAIGVMRSYTPAINNLGVLYYRQKKYLEAKRYFIRATKSNPFSKVPKLNLANLYLEFGHYKTGCSLIQKLYQYLGNDKKVRESMGFCLVLEKKYLKAIELYKTMDDQDLIRPHIGLNYVVALKKTSQDDSAIKIFEDVKVIEGMNTSYYYYIKEMIFRGKK